MMQSKTSATDTLFVSLPSQGLAVIQGAKMAGASKIIAIDLNPEKFENAKKLGATDCLDPRTVEGPVQNTLLESQVGELTMFPDCTGNTEAMRSL
jgi:S-(hydroxymethyl)glutathione dehydrogenase/alcohol dehydrogenase